MFGLSAARARVKRRRMESFREGHLVRHPDHPKAWQLIGASGAIDLEIERAWFGGVPFKLDVQTDAGDWLPCSVVYSRRQEEGRDTGWVLVTDNRDFSESLRSLAERHALVRLVRP